MARSDLTPDLLLMSEQGGSALALSRQRVVDALRALPPPAPVAAVVALVGLHANTVREHLDSLVSEGLAETQRERSGTRGRPRTLYRLTAQGVLRRAPGEEVVKLAAIVLSAFGEDEVRAREASIAAGTRWGETDAVVLKDVETPVERVRIALDAAGAAPMVDVADGDSSGCIDTAHCPFDALAAVRPDVVCAIHGAAIAQVARGLAQDDVTVTVRRFAGRDDAVCRVVIEAAGPRS